MKKWFESNILLNWDDLILTYQYNFIPYFIKVSRNDETTIPFSGKIKLITFEVGFSSKRKEPIDNIQQIADAVQKGL